MATATARTTGLWFRGGVDAFLVVPAGLFQRWAIRRESCPRGGAVRCDRRRALAARVGTPRADRSSMATTVHDVDLSGQIDSTPRVGQIDHIWPLQFII